MENRFSLSKTAKIHGQVLYLPTLFRGAFITTNFDNVVERLLKSQDVDQEYKSITGYDLIKNDISESLTEPILIKIHGDGSNHSTRILISEEYDKLYGNPDFLVHLRAIFSDHPLLFLGCSLKSDRYLDILDSLVKERSIRVKHYALMVRGIKESEYGYHDWIAKEDKRLNSYNIFPIWIDDYSDIETIFVNLLRLQSEEGG